MTRTAAQRYNARLEAIFAEFHRLQIQCNNCKRLYHHELPKCPMCEEPK